MVSTQLHVSKKIRKKYRKQLNALIKSSKLEIIGTVFYLKNTCTAPNRFLLLIYHYVLSLLRWKTCRCSELRYGELNFSFGFICAGLLYQHRTSSTQVNIINCGVNHYPCKVLSHRYRCRTLTLINRGKGKHSLHRPIVRTSVVINHLTLRYGTRI